MNDLIKREDAIRGKKAQTLNANAEFMMGRFCNEDESRIYNIGFAEGWNAHIERCKDIPSVESKQGKWRKHDKERDYCSICKHIFKTRTLTKQDKWTTYVDDLGYNFCPNCGARMVKQ